MMVGRNKMIHPRMIKLLVKNSNYSKNMALELFRTLATQNKKEKTQIARHKWYKVILMKSKKMK